MLFSITRKHGVMLQFAEFATSILLFPSPQPHLSRTEETIILTIRDIVVFLASFGRSFAISGEFAWFIYACIPSGESSTCSKSTPNSRKKTPWTKDQKLRRMHLQSKELC